MLHDENKFSKFVAAITKEANENREKLLNEVKIYKETALNKAKSAAAEDYNARILKYTATVKEDCGKKLSKNIFEIKSGLFAEREQIKNSVFEKVKKRISSFTQSDEYSDFLTNSVNAMADYITPDSVLLARAEEVQFVQKLTKCKVCADDEIKLGGIKLKTVCAVFDDTLDTRLNKQNKWFEENSDLHIS